MADAWCCGDSLSTELVGMSDLFSTRFLWSIVVFFDVEQKEWRTSEQLVLASHDVLSP